MSLIIIYNINKNYIKQFYFCAKTIFLQDINKFLYFYFKKKMVTFYYTFCLNCRSNLHLDVNSKLTFNGQMNFF